VVQKITAIEPVIIHFNPEVDGYFKKAAFADLPEQTNVHSAYSAGLACTFRSWMQRRLNLQYPGCF